MTVQELGDQLVIAPIGHSALPTMEAQVDRVDAVDGEMGSDVDVCVDRGAVLATNAGSQGYWAGKSEVELLFSQQFQIQQRIEDLHEEMNNMFTVQKLYLQIMDTNVKRIVAQPVVHSYPVQR